MAVKLYAAIDCSFFGMIKGSIGINLMMNEIEYSTCRDSLYPNLLVSIALLLLLQFQLAILFFLILIRLPMCLRDNFRFLRILFL